MTDPVPSHMTQHKSLLSCSIQASWHTVRKVTRAAASSGNVFHSQAINAGVSESHVLLLQRNPTRNLGWHGKYGASLENTALLLWNLTLATWGQNGIESQATPSTTEFFFWGWQESQSSAYTHTVMPISFPLSQTRSWFESTQGRFCHPPLPSSSMQCNGF